MWSEQADLLRTLIFLLAVIGSMMVAFRNWFRGDQKNRADAYNKDLIALLEAAEKGEHTDKHSRTELGRILTQVVDDLDNDRISREGFDEFSFTWQAVSRLLETSEQTDVEGATP